MARIIQKEKSREKDLSKVHKKNFLWSGLGASNLLEGGHSKRERPGLSGARRGRQPRGEERPRGETERLPLPKAERKGTLRKGI